MSVCECVLPRGSGALEWCQSSPSVMRPNGNVFRDQQIRRKMEVKKEGAEKKSDRNHDDSDSLRSAFVFI